MNVNDAQQVDVTGSLCMHVTEKPLVLALFLSFALAFRLHSSAAMARRRALRVAAVAVVVVHSCSSLRTCLQTRYSSMPSRRWAACGCRSFNAAARMKLECAPAKDSAATHG
jgi:hypothetical protein